MADKKGVIYLLRYLFENTDMDHPANTRELQAVLKEHGYAADPRTIRKDAMMLREAGYDVIINDQIGMPSQYYYGALPWDHTEVKILIDAVSSAQFITMKKTKQLIDKLSVLAGKQNEDVLAPKVYISEHVKAENDNLFYVIENVSQGIRQRKKIAFQMYNYNEEKCKVLRHDGEIYVLSPYHTVWVDDRYYVVGYSDKRQQVVTMRIDRMSVPEILEEEAVPPPEDYNVQDYAGIITKMYAGTREEVTLRCKTCLMDAIIDKFGKEIEITNIQPESFDATATVAVSGTFFSWVFQFAGEIVILGPENVCAMYREMLETATGNQEAGDLKLDRKNGWKL